MKLQVINTTVNNSRARGQPGRYRIQSRVSPVENTGIPNRTRTGTTKKASNPPKAASYSGGSQGTAAEKSHPPAAFPPPSGPSPVPGPPPPLRDHPVSRHKRPSGVGGTATAMPGKTGRPAAVLTAGGGQGCPSGPRCSRWVPGSAARSGRAGSGPRCRRRLTGPQLRHSPRAHSRPPPRAASAPPRSPRSRRPLAAPPPALALSSTLIGRSVAARRAPIGRTGRGGGGAWRRGRVQNGPCRGTAPHPGRLERAGLQPRGPIVCRGPRELCSAS